MACGLLRFAEAFDRAQCNPECPGEFDQPSSANARKNRAIETAIDKCGDFTCQLRSRSAWR